MSAGVSNRLVAAVWVITLVLVVAIVVLRAHAEPLDTSMTRLAAPHWTKEVQRKIATDPRVREWDSAAAAGRADGRTDLSEFYTSLSDQVKQHIADSASMSSIVAAARRKIRGMVIGQTTEKMFLAQWNGQPSTGAERLDFAFGFVASPKSLETVGKRTTTYFVGRRARQSAPDFYWAVTFKNGVLESIYTY